MEEKAEQMRMLNKLRWKLAASVFFTLIFFLYMVYNSLTAKGMRSLVALVHSCLRISFVGQTRAKASLGADLCLGFAPGALIGGLHSIQIARYLRLPDVTRYGKLLRINPFLVRFPNFMVRFGIASTCFTTISMLMLTVLIPRLRPDLRNTADKVYLALFSLILFIIGLVGSFIFRSLIQIYDLAIRVKTNAGKGNSVKTCPMQVLRDQELEYLKVAFFALSEFFLVCLFN